MMTIRSGCVTWLFALTGLFGFVEVCFAKDAELTGMDQKQLVLVNQERIAQRLSAFVAGRLNLFDEAGRWLGPEHMTPYRALEPLALAQAYLAEGSDAAVEQANRWLSHTDVLEWHRGSYVYLKYRDLLSVASRNNMRAILDEMAPDYLDPSWDFVGENDNFPLMATAFCAFYWKMSGDQQYYDTALGRLKQFAKQLTRSGAQSEYSSQAYAFLQIEPAAMIVELMEDPSLRELALKIEERLWFDTLMHYYEPAQKMVGPYSRAYMWDMRGVGLNYAIFDMILGDRFLDQDLDDYFDTSEGWIKARNASCYGLELHCPEYLVEAMWEREYPFRFIARADGGPGSDGEEMKRLGLTMKTRSLYEDDGVIEYGCIQTRIETFMTEDYTLGTSTIPFHDGAQSETFLVVYENGEHQREVATVFARMVINGELPLAGDTDGYGDQGIGCRERGRKLAVQDRNVAMVAMTPKLGLSEGVKSLHSAFLVPNERWGTGPIPFEEIWIGDQRVEMDKPIFRDESEPVIFRDGDVYMAVVPFSDAKALSLVNRDGYTVLSFENHDGDMQDFSRRKISTMGGGYGFAIGSASEYPSFAAFRTEVAAARAESEYRTNDHYRTNHVRNVYFSFKGTELEMEYSPSVERIRYITVNGQYQESPRLEVSGFPVEQLPFSN
jgi:hypothetical protein